MATIRAKNAVGDRTTKNVVYNAKSKFCKLTSDGKYLIIDMKFIRTYLLIFPAKAYESSQKKDPDFSRSLVASRSIISRGLWRHSRLQNFLI